jgi:hypothetical protein
MATASRVENPPEERRLVLSEPRSLEKGPQRAGTQMSKKMHCLAQLISLGLREKRYSVAGSGSTRSWS